MKVLVLSTMFLFTLPVFAKDSSSGCGPGWYVARKNSILSSALRATTNIVLFPTTTIGMTFGTSNCKRHSLVKNEMQDLKYATENYFEIAADTAKGDGLFISAFSDLMGCKGVMETRFKGKMQESFVKLFKQDGVNPQALLKETYIVILKDQQLRSSCFPA